MMRKIFLSILSFIVLYCIGIPVNAHNIDLSDDPDYILCGAGMGAKRYVDVNSLAVEEYNPPRYIIAVNVVTVPPINVDAAWPLRTKKYRFLYDYDKRKMYVYSKHSNGDLRARYENARKNSHKPIDKSIDWDSEWVYIAPDVYYGEGSNLPSIGEIAFALAYNLKFHGQPYFKEDLYDKIVMTRGEVKDIL